MDGSNEKHLFENMVSHQRTKRKKYADDHHMLPSSFISIQLYGKLAKKWAAERRGLSDSVFVERLLLIRQQFIHMFQECKCESRSNFPVDLWTESEPNEEIEENITNSEEKIYDTEFPENSDDKDPIWRIEVDNYEDDDDEYQISDEDDIDIMQSKRKFPYISECELCHKVMSKGEKKKNHLLEHFTFYINCEMCKKRSEDPKAVKHGKSNNFIRVDDFLEHMKSNHNIDDVACSYCDKKIVSLNEKSYGDHLFEKHLKELYCHCKECKGDENGDVSECKILRASSIRGHISTRHCDVDQKRIPCKICGTLITKKCILRHVKNQHEENVQRSVKNLCDLCGKYFVHLKEHKASVHGDKESWEFKCKTCGKNFSKKWNLEVHSRLHTGEKPYVCDVCGKRFCQNVELQLHTRNNHGTPKKKIKLEKLKKAKVVDIVSLQPNRLVTSIPTKEEIRKLASVLSKPAYNTVLTLNNEILMTPDNAADNAVISRNITLVNGGKPHQVDKKIDGM